MTAGTGRLAIVQYAGDFREASDRLRRGDAETYRGQRYTVDYVEGLAGRLASVTTITGFTDEEYDVVLASGARAIGAGFHDWFDDRTIITLLDRINPDLLILRTPARGLLRWAIARRCRTMLLLADSSNERSLRSRVGKFLLARLLRSPVVEVVANHGRRAAEQLVASGVPAAKVIAWDYPAFDSPANRPAKTKAADAHHIIYVGMLIEGKGVDDLIEASRLLVDRGVRVQVDLIGSGDQDRLHALIAARGLEDVVQVVGKVPNHEIIARMVEADAVVVPSRHEYSEGMPLTIYEAYCARTPLIVSDHPMFVGNVVDGYSGVVFEAGNVRALADQVERLFNDTALYAVLSANAPQAWEKLQISNKWHDLIDRWIINPAGSQAWVRELSWAEAGTGQRAS